MGLPASSFETVWVARTMLAPGLEPWSAAEARRDVTVFWEDPRHQVAVAGFGTLAVEEGHSRAETFEVLSRIFGPTSIGWSGDRPPGPWFGGLAFDLARPPGALWDGFPPCRWILPELLVWKKQSKCFVTGFAAQAPGALQSLEAKLTEAAGRFRRQRSTQAEAGADIRVESDGAAWQTLVGRALSMIGSGTLSKVVAARSVLVSSTAPLNPLGVLGRLRNYSRNCASFLFRGKDGSAFLGATPETLCRIRGSFLETEAVGGSSQPGDSEQWVLRDKEQREHRAILDAMVEGLEPLCDSLEIGSKQEVLALPHLSHLKTPIRAKLKPSAGLAEVVRALHPTPAVGGCPRDRALAFLAENENLERGWYAGAVGCAGEGEAELKTALRCALIRGPKAHAFVGAGIVAGSTPSGEWEETESKCVPMLEALGAVRD